MVVVTSLHPGNEFSRVLCLTRVFVYLGRHSAPYVTLFVFAVGRCCPLLQTGAPCRGGDVSRENFPAEARLPFHLPLRGPLALSSYFLREICRHLRYFVLFFFLASFLWGNIRLRGDQLFLEVNIPICALNFRLGWGLILITFSVGLP